MFKNLVDHTKERFETQKQSEVGYIHYDFHAACHENTDPYSLFVENIVEEWIGP